MTLQRKTPMKATKPRRRKCEAPGCRRWFVPAVMGQTACRPFPCAVEVGKLKAEKKRQRQHREDRQNVKPLVELCSQAQPDVNRYIRARDHDKGCISCPSPFIDDAGHFVHAGSKFRTSRLRFDERNLHGQCSKCNRFVGGGNNQAYREGLVARYGQAYVDDLDRLKLAADRNELEPLTKDEVRQIAKDARRRAREIERSRGVV